MTDPFTLGLAVGAASGAGKHLAESFISAAKQWLTGRFKDHNEKAIEKADRNAANFVHRLAEKVSQLEEAQQVDRAIIDRAMEEPSFGALLQNALISSAQTESADKQDLLAALVSGRLTAGTESVLAASSQMAVNAVAHCSPRQLRLLGFLGSLTLRINLDQIHPMASKAAMVAACKPWFETRFAPYADLAFRQIDGIHLV